MSRVTVDRLTLKLTGLSPAAGEPFGRRLALKLASANLDLNASARIATLYVIVTPHPGESQEALSDRITSEILRTLERKL
jgi:hypothetical protein